MPFNGNQRFAPDKLLHYRLWSNNKYDLNMACGKFDRISKYQFYLHYTDLMIEVTCPDCYATFTKDELKSEALDILDCNEIEDLSLLEQKRIKELLKSEYIK